jgi:hypothetical protein
MTNQAPETQKISNLLETAQYFSEYVLVYTMNRERKYYSKQSSGEDTWLTNKIDDASKYKNKDSAIEVARVHEKTVGDVFGWTDFSIEAKELRIRMELVV